jgi:glycosyltransferase involved in cell wall biosynthesis
MKHEASPPRCLAILPALNEERAIRAVVEAVRAQGVDVAVVNDGSTDSTADAARAGGAHVLEHPRNLGKGAALNTGFAHARAGGYETVLTLDADGQHDPADIPLFLEAYARTRIPVLIGNRMADRDRMPLVRRWTNQYMSWLLSRHMGQYVPDTQCGFRLYRTDVIPRISDDTPGFAAESEILLRMAKRGVRMDAVPLKAVYGEERSKINPLRDTLRFFSMLRRMSRDRRRKG